MQPAWLQHDATPPGGASPDEATRDDTRTVTREPIVCKTCDSEVSERAALFLIDGDRVHRVFANPHGYLHEIVTVRRAWGLLRAGPTTTEFSWYRGYAWTLVHCAACMAHLGWEYEAVAEHAPARFWGLRRACVRGA